MPMPTLFEQGWAYYIATLTALTQQPINVSYRYWDRIFYDVKSVQDIEPTLFPGGDMVPARLWSRRDPRRFPTRGRE